MEINDELVNELLRNALVTNRACQQSHPCEGKFCVFRGRMFGVYAGFYERSVAVAGVGYAVVRNARRLQYQKYNGFTLSSVAELGLSPESKLSPAVDLHTLQLSDAYEIFACSKSAADQIAGLPNG